MDEMEQMMLQMEQMKELIVVLKQEQQEEAESMVRAEGGDGEVEEGVEEREGKQRKREGR